MSEDLHPTLRRNAPDRANDLLVALSSVVDLCAPGWGSGFSFLVGQVIPNRREDRIAEFVAKVARNLDRLEQRVSVLEALSAEKIALFEDGAREAARSTTSDRIEKIAEIVAGGIAADDMESAMRRDLLALFASLSDAEVATLAEYAGVRSGPRPSSATEIDREADIAALRRISARSKFSEVRLISLGLLEQKQSLVPDRYRLGTRARQENPQKIVADRPSVTSVGRALLAELGLVPSSQYR